jgi:hypothetical protein
LRARTICRSGRLALLPVFGQDKLVFASDEIVFASDEIGCEVDTGLDELMRGRPVPPLVSLSVGLAHLAVGKTRRDHQVVELDGAERPQVGLADAGAGDNRARAANRRSMSLRICARRSSSVPMRSPVR